MTSTSNEGNLMELEREEASRSAFKPDFLSLSHAVHFPNTLTSSVSETADTNTSYNQSGMVDQWWIVVRFSNFFRVFVCCD